MFWVGLATLIMLLTGAGDDTREFRKRVKQMQQVTQEVVTDTQRAAQARQALSATSTAFAAHRGRLDLVAKCIAQADANYRATREDYYACVAASAQNWDTAVTEFAAAEREFRAALQPTELKAIHDRLRAK